MQEVFVIVRFALHVSGRVQIIVRSVITGTNFVGMGSQNKLSLLSVTYTCSPSETPSLR